MYFQLFWWFISAVYCQLDPHLHGQRSVYVHLFEWKWSDIAEECERFLGPKGFGAVQISPPNEHRVITDPFRPWWERYQPVSYMLESRSGTQREFADMVERCNKANVRIYADVVINHMAAGLCFFPNNSGIAGSFFDAVNLDFPTVPFTASDFKSLSDCPVETTSNQTYEFYIQQARSRCSTLALPNLRHSNQNVRDKLVQYLNTMVDLGVAGFRVDAAKHIWPLELKAILDQVKDLDTRFFPVKSRPFVYHEVIDLGGEPLAGVSREYTGFGRVTEFKFGRHVSQVVQRPGGELMKDLRDFDKIPGIVASEKAMSFIDNHDNQRGHGMSGPIILTFRKARQYKIANAFMLAHPYGYAQLMSSYDWPTNTQNCYTIGICGEQYNWIKGTKQVGTRCWWAHQEEQKFRQNWRAGYTIGPPSDNYGNTSSVLINPDGSCGGGWVCEHRWRQLANMVRFRNVAGSGGLVHWWDNTANQIAFGRGLIGNTTAFIVINNDDVPLQADIETGLSPGVYCDILSGEKKANSCTGKSVTVDAKRIAHFVIGHTEDDPVVAIHLNSKLNSARTLVFSIYAFLFSIAALLFLKNV